MFRTRPSTDIWEAGHIAKHHHERKRSIYQLKVTLRGSRPAVWRRILVPDDTLLSELHAILQTVMGWSDDHLHQFVIKGIPYADPERVDDPWVKDELVTSLRRAAGAPGAVFLYVYDFGDCWEHLTDVEKVVPREKNVTYPVCIAGSGACPPEDCGGIPAYRHLIACYRNPRAHHHAAAVGQLGLNFDPKAFDIKRINAMLTKCGAGAEDAGPVYTISQD